MDLPGEAADAPPPFQRALASLRTARVRPEVSVQPAQAPQRLAPYATALSATVTRADTELASGRLFVLYDPQGQTGWEGTFRAVTYVSAELEPEIAADPLLPSVGWSWLTEMLEAHGASHVAASGTVTRVVSESFGGMADEPATSEVELRASWTPVSEELDRHLYAWCDVLCLAAGIPPLPPDVTAMPERPDGP